MIKPIWFLPCAGRSIVHADRSEPQSRAILER